MNLKFTIIYENNKDNLALQEGFGFSCLIEWNNTKILFDTGGNQIAFFSNIKKLNIDLKNITHIIFSHKHNDHTAGFEEVLNNVSNPQIYLPHDFPNSLLKQIPSNLNTKIVNLFTEIDKNIYSLPLIGKYLGIVIHEQSLIFDTAKGIIILTGCAHPGVANILKVVKKKFPTKKIHLVIGGFHLFQSWRFTSAKVIRQFQEIGVEKVAPCHCTGKVALQQFEKHFKENFIKIGTGTSFEIKFD
ncbi:hypothetical protein A3C57_01285 [Candidatus Nomurabacteria bacterium RIFCSPHIGHO2_02_FULL_33_12]|nr:MAG: hypothetical protein A3C57_01285 [Candidatus Nomurabacteria bacterium RIFCSPHIGHO2_02_FULL_33_12]